MADASMTLLETLRKVGADGDVDLLREGVRVLAAAIMEAEVSELTGAAKGHAGLVRAVREQLLGASWQRCRVHLTRNAQDLVPRSARSLVASAIRMVFEQPDGRAAREQLDRVFDGLQPRFAAVAELLTGAEPDVLAHFAFPEIHRRQIRSTNPLERAVLRRPHDSGVGQDESRHEHWRRADVSLPRRRAW